MIIQTAQTGSADFVGSAVLDGAYRRWYGKLWNHHKIAYGGDCNPEQWDKATWEGQQHEASLLCDLLHSEGAKTVTVDRDGNDIITGKIYRKGETVTMEKTDVIILEYA